MICPKCKTKDKFNEVDEEMVCEECGSAFLLEYIGYYEEGSNELVAEGYESEEWKKKYG